jgi:pyrimidine operon attenuation protein/uracil phosphoribosyltransferase
MATQDTLVLNTEQIEQKINRIAMQVYERNHTAQSIVMAGVYGTGTKFAQRLAAAIEKLSPIKVTLVSVQVDKQSPVGKRAVLSDDSVLQDGALVLVVDDVLNSGRTLIHALEPFLGTQLKALQTVVLVDRNHPSYPVKADYVGLSMATTLQEHIDVILDAENEGVYLN